MKKLYSLLLTSLILVLLSGCTQYGKLDEGDCKGVVAFINIPKTFFMMEESLQEQVEIRVRLKNVTTEKIYEIILDKENNYRQEISLHPGTYMVLSAYALNSRSTGVNVKAVSETLEFTREQETRLDIVLRDEEEFTKHWADAQPLPEILLADKFSGLVQVNRKVVPIAEILSELNLSGEQTVEAYQKESVSDNELGITVTVQNLTGSSLAFDQCTVVGITSINNTVVFPEGVTIGSLSSSVCHKKSGVYGEPASFSGIALFGWGIADTRAIYNDPESGNRITFTFDDSGEYISSIQYELAVFE